MTKPYNPRPHPRLDDIEKAQPPMAHIATKAKYSPALTRKPITQNEKAKKTK